MTLTVGHITYANCAPFFHYLTAAGFQGHIVPGVPAELNLRLAAGEIDLSPSSSFEYARNWRDYLLLPGFSISSRGPVQSVLLFTPGPLEDLACDIALTGESATSVNLLHVLLREYLRLPHLRCLSAERPVEEVIASGGAALLIGDRALKASRSAPPGVRIYDLGELWLSHTGLPFVFALWIVRRAAAQQKHEEIARLLYQLKESRRLALSDLPGLAAEAAERAWMAEADLLAYWQAMEYGLDADHQQGLRLFFELCVKHGLLGEMPELRFFS